MMRTLNNPCFCFPQPPPAQSMVQALELLYALGGENIILCFTYSFLKGVVQLKLFVVFFFLTYFSLLRISFLLFSGYFTQVSKGKAKEMTFWEELENCIAYKLECICFDYAKADFTAILLCINLCFRERNQVFAIARNRILS